MTSSVGHLESSTSFIPKQEEKGEKQTILQIQFNRIVDGAIGAVALHCGHLQVFSRVIFAPHSVHVLVPSVDSRVARWNSISVAAPTVFLLL